MKMVAAVLQPSDFCHHFRRPQRPLQGRLAASLAAAGLSGGKFWPLQGRYTRPSFNGAAAIFKFNVAAAVKCSLCYLRVLLLLF